MLSLISLFNYYYLGGRGRKGGNVQIEEGKQSLQLLLSSWGKRGGGGGGADRLKACCKVNDAANNIALLSFFYPYLQLTWIEHSRNQNQNKLE